MARLRYVRVVGLGKLANFYWDQFCVCLLDGRPFIQHRKAPLDVLELLRVAHVRCYDKGAAKTVTLFWELLLIWTVGMGSIDVLWGR